MNIESKNENPKGSLKNRMLNSGLWTMGGHLLSQIIRLSSNLIMTRLLMPELFGVMAMVSVIQEGLSSVSQVGLTESIVNSSRGHEKIFLDTAWLIKILRGFIIAITMLIIATALFFAAENGIIPSNSGYSHPDLPKVLAVSSLGIIVAGFSSTYANALVKQISLKRLVIMELTGQIAGIITMITWAWIEKSIWALVSGGIVSELIKVIISHRLVKNAKNGFNWESNSFREILQTSRWMFLAGLFFYLSSQSDRLILGALIPAEMLGIYTIAFFLSSALRMMLMQVYTRVFFPALREVYNTSPSQLPITYYRIRRTIDMVIFPITAIMMTWADTIIDILYDDRYYQAGQMLEILSISIIGVGFRMADQVIQACGKFKLNTYLTVFQGVMTPVMILSGFYLFQLQGLLWAISLSFIPYNLLSWIILRKIGVLNIKRELLYLPIFPIFYLLCIELKKLTLL